MESRTMVERQHHVVKLKTAYVVECPPVRRVKVNHFERLRQTGSQQNLCEYTDAMGWRGRRTDNHTVSNRSFPTVCFVLGSA